MATAKKKKPAHMVKGSLAAKKHMAKLRASRASNPAPKKKKVVTKKAAPKKVVKKAAPKKAVKKGRPALSAAQKAKKAISSAYKKRPSTATKSAPSKRLIARRAVNTRPGTFPNPSSRKGYVIFLCRGSNVGYFDGAAFDTEKNKAVIFQSKEHGERIAKQLAKKLPKRVSNIDLGVVPLSMTTSQIKKELGA